MKRRLVPWAMCGALVLALFPTGPASAKLPAQVPSRTWMVNGPVRAMVLYKGAIYIGGHFTELRSKAGRGGQVKKVKNLAALDAATGRPLKGFKAPKVRGNSGYVYALAIYKDRLIVGGDFTKVGGKPRGDIASVRPKSGAVGTFAPHVTGDVLALLGTKSHLYVGGAFQKVNNQARGHLAAFNSNWQLDAGFTPSTTSSHPNPIRQQDGRVRVIRLAPDKKTIFVTGHFDQAAGSGGSFSSRRIARFNANTGALTSWTVPELAVDQFSLSMIVTKDRVYQGTGRRDEVAAFRLSDGHLVWKTDTDGTINGMALIKNRLVIGGHFKRVANHAGQECGGVPNPCAIRWRLAAVRTASGALVKNWGPKLTGNYVGIWTLLNRGAHVFLGGDFTAVSGHPQKYFAKLDP